jgi:hypothetical protein
MEIRDLGSGLGGAATAPRQVGASTGAAESVQEDDRGGSGGAGFPPQGPWKLNLDAVPASILKALFFLALIGLVVWAYSLQLKKGQTTAESFSSDIRLQLQEKFYIYQLGVYGNLAAIPGELDKTIKGYLMEHARTAVLMAQAHLRIAEKLYKFYYALLLMSVATTAISTMLLFFIMKTGWSQTNDYVQIAFVVLSISAVGFNLGQSVFQHGDNIESHKKLYVQCMQIEGDIVAYAQVYKPGNTKIKAPDAFLLEIAEKIKSTWQLSMTFDPGKIQSPGELVNKITEATKK